MTAIPRIPRLTARRWSDTRRGRRALRSARELGWAIFLSLLAFGVRYAIDPLVGDRQPFTPSYAVVALASWVAGWRAGLWTTAFCFMWADYFFIHPRYSLALDGIELANALSYSLVNVIIVYLAHRASVANRVIRRESERKDNLRAMLTHELQLPLNALSRGVDAVARKASDDNGLGAIAGMLHRHVGQVRRLLHDNVGMSELAPTSVQLKRETCDIRLCVQDAIDENADATGEKLQHVDVTMSAAPIMAHVDPVRVTQIIANLLNNASKFSPMGATIRIVVAQDARQVAVSVKDSGRGVAPSAISALFDEGRHDATPRGPGISLQLSRRYAALHGGTIVAQSEGPGKGSEFWLILPHAA